MKKIIVILTLTLVIGCISSIASAGAVDISVKVNNKNVTFPDTKPFINEDGRTLVPVRFVTEALGGNVKWFSASKIVKIDKDSKVILIKVGEKEASVNSSSSSYTAEFDTTTRMKDGRVMIPLRFVSEILGATVKWDNKTKAIDIGFKEPTIKLIPSITPLITSVPIKN